MPVQWFKGPDELLHQAAGEKMRFEKEGTNRFPHAGGSRPVPWVGFYLMALGLHRLPAFADTLPQASQEYFISVILPLQTLSAGTPQRLLLCSSLAGWQSLLESSAEAPQFWHVYDMGNLLF